MGLQLQGNRSSVNSYVLHFTEAQKNLHMVCEEYKNTLLCRKARRREKKKS